MTAKRSRGLTRRLAGLAFELTPQVFAVICFTAGAVVLASAATPAFSSRLAVLDRALHPILIDLSHFAASVAGFLLLALSAGLWRRRRGADCAALIVLVGGSALSLLKGLDWEEAIELAVVAALLAPCRAAFNRSSRLSEPLRPSWMLLVAAVVAASLWLGFFAYRDVAYQDELWWTFLTDRQASGFLRAAAVLALLTLLIAGRSLFAAPGARSHRASSTRSGRPIRPATAISRMPAVWKHSSTARGSMSVAPCAAPWFGPSELDMSPVAVRPSIQAEASTW